MLLILSQRTNPGFVPPKNIGSEGPLFSKSGPRPKKKENSLSSFQIRYATQNILILAQRPNPGFVSLYGPCEATPPEPDWTNTTDTKLIHPSIRSHGTRPPPHNIPSPNPGITGSRTPRERQRTHMQRARRADETAAAPRLASEAEILTPTGFPPTPRGSTVC